MLKNKELLDELQTYYSLWKKSNSIYEEWAKTHGLSMNSLLVLHTFYDNNGVCTQKFICQKWGIPKQTVNTILKGFESQGYVKLISLDEDKRNKEIRLTTEGKQYAESIINKLQEKELHVMNEIGFEQMKTMNQIHAMFINFMKKKNKYVRC